MGPFVPNALALRKRGGDAFDPSMDSAGYSSSAPASAPIPTASDAIRPTLLSSSEAARSPSGGNRGPGISPIDPEHTFMKDLQDVSGRLSAAYAAPRPGMARQVIGALFARKNPALGGIISGETQREQAIQPLQQQYSQLGQLITSNRAQQRADLYDRNIQSEIEHRTDTDTKLSRAVIEGEQGNARAVDFDPRSGAYLDPDTRQPILGAKPFQKAAAVPKPNDFEQFYKDYLDDKKLPDTSRSRLAARREYAAAGQTPQRPSQQLAVGPDGKVIELKPGMTVPQGTKSVSGDLGNAKTNNDEQRRADLASNLSENLDQLEEIAKRRPDLFGPAAGRLTSAKQFVGTSDPDVAALATIKEQTGMAMVGTHAMRNAQHVEKAADSIINAYKNKSEALLGPSGSISKARASLKTFLAKQPVIGGETNTTGGGSAGAQSPPAGAKIRDYTDLKK